MKTSVKLSVQANELKRHHTLNSLQFSYTLLQVHTNLKLYEHNAKLQKISIHIKCRCKRLAYKQSKLLLETGIIVEAVILDVFETWRIKAPKLAGTHFEVYLSIYIRRGAQKL